MFTIGPRSNKLIDGGGNCTEDYLQSDSDIARCSAKLLDSRLFNGHQEYVRRQIIYCLLQVNWSMNPYRKKVRLIRSEQEDSPDVLYHVSSFLIVDGRQNERTFEVMNDEGAFSRLVELVKIMQDSGAGLHRMLMQLLYEMSRIQRIRHQELGRA